MRKQNSEIISENENGDFIEVIYDRKGNPQCYLIFFADNGVTISACPDTFTTIKQLFWSLTKDLEADSHEEY